MALFKILSNMVNSTEAIPRSYNLVVNSGVTTDILSSARSNSTLPVEYHQGYCYFDISTGKFWVDTTADDNTTPQQKQQGRIALNAYKSDVAILANAAIYETTEETNSPLNKIRTYYGHSLNFDENHSLSLIAGDGTTPLGDPIVNLVTSSTTATDNAVARFDGATGKIIQDSNVIIDDNDKVTTPLGFVSNSTTQTNSTGFIVNRNNQIQAYLQNSTIGTSSSGGVATLSLGNALSTSTDLNSRGTIRIYGVGAGYHRIYSGNTGTNAIGVYLQNSTGDQYLIHGATASAIGANEHPVYIAANGLASEVDCTKTMNNFINSLAVGTSAPVDNDYFIAQFTNGGDTNKVYRRKTMSQLWDYISEKINVTNSAPTLAWGTTSTIGSVNGTNLTVKMPTSTAGTSTLAWNSEITLATVGGLAIKAKLPAEPTDTNTHRPIQMNDTQILGNNTTALNLKAGSNVTLSNSSGTVTIAATDTTYSSLGASSGNTAVSLVTRGEKYTWNNKSTVSISRSLTSGTKIGTITIDGTATDLYCQTDTNTDTKVTITSKTGNYYYRVALSGTANDDQNTEGLSKSTNLTFNPSTSLLRVGPTDGTLSGKIDIYSNDSTTPTAARISAYYADPGGGSTITYLNVNKQFKASKVWGAVWNDYAEFRKARQNIEPGQCVIETKDGVLRKSTGRLMRGGAIVSDTYGFAIGTTEDSKTPIAVSGRVLAYCLEGQEYAKDHIGWPVGTGPDGTISIMTEEEEMKYPSRIVGIISEVPDYDKWQCGTKEEPEYVDVNDRIWIKVR